MREEKKYEILPGVEIPDIKRIQEAASDFSISEVGDVELRTVTLQPVIEPIAPGVSAEELSNLQSLGVKVAEYNNVDSIDAIETAGIYVIRVTIDGDARNCRLVVK